MQTIHYPTFKICMENIQNKIKLYLSVFLNTMEFSKFKKNCIFAYIQVKDTGYCIYGTYILKR